MTKQQQTLANMKLLDKLTGYLADHPQEELGEDISLSYVMFSSTSGELNAMNEKLLETLLNEGERVVKAEETDDKNMPWKFTPVFT